MLEQLYKEMTERMKLLEGESYSYENEIRKEELTLAIVRVQQLLLNKLNDNENNKI